MLRRTTPAAESYAPTPGGGVGSGRVGSDRSGADAAEGRGFRVHDAHDAVQAHARELAEGLVERGDRLGRVDQPAGLDEEVVHRAHPVRLAPRAGVQHAPHLRLELPAQGATQTPVRELDDALVRARGPRAGVLARHELGVDVELGEVVHRARHAQILSVREDVAHHRRLAAAEPTRDERRRQPALLRLGEHRSVLEGAVQVHRRRLPVRGGGRRGRHRRVVAVRERARAAGAGRAKSPRRTERKRETGGGRRQRSRRRQHASPGARDARQSRARGAERAAVGERGLRIRIPPRS